MGAILLSCPRWRNRLQRSEHYGGTGGLGTVRQIGGLLGLLRCSLLHGDGPGSELEMEAEPSPSPKEHRLLWAQAHSTA